MTLHERLYTTGNLMLAFRKARRGKLEKPGVVAFSRSLKTELRHLQGPLRNLSWQPGPFSTFPIFEPKMRMISAAPFCDRVVHHALMNVVEPILERRQIFHSYACRPGKGTHACVRQAYRNQRRFSWFLRLDVRKFFDSIPHVRLLELLRREVWDPGIFSLLERIVHAAGCDGRGLPIGNLTSQHFANFYLSYLDHFVLQTLRPCAYVRYMDDFVLWGRGRQEMSGWLTAIRAFLSDALGLILKDSATEIAPAARGLSFLGFRILPDRIRLGQRSLQRLRGHLRRFRKKWERTGDWENLRHSWDAVHGHAATAHIRSLRRTLLSVWPSLEDGAVAAKGLRPVPTG